MNAELQLFVRTKCHQMHDVLTIYCLFSNHFKIISETKITIRLSINIKCFRYAQLEME